MQSSGPSTIAPRVAANSWTKAAEDVPRPAARNSITWRASHERTYTQWTQSASFAAAITCTPPSSCTVGPTWSGCARTSGRRGPPLQPRRFRQSRPLLAPGRAPSDRYSERGLRRPSLPPREHGPERTARKRGPGGSPAPRRVDAGRERRGSSALRQRAGETEPEPAAVADRALHSDRAAVRLDDLARDHQAEPAADDARAAGGAGEALEDAGELVGGDAGAVVLDAGGDEGGLHLDDRLDRPRRRGELDRVAEQVRDHLREAARVADHARRGVRLDGAHVQLRRIDERPQLLEGFVQDGGEIDLALVESLHRRFHPRHVEKVVHHVDEGAGAAIDLAQIVEQLGGKRSARSAEERPEPQQHGVHRGAQFVGDDGVEVEPPRVGAPLLGHVAERDEEVGLVPPHERPRRRTVDPVAVADVR